MARYSFSNHFSDEGNLGLERLVNLMKVTYLGKLNLNLILSLDL